jgi:hypothetical protein
MHRVFLDQRAECLSVGRYSLAPRRHLEQRVGDGLVVGYRQQIIAEIKSWPYPAAGLDLSHQHEQHMSGRGIERLRVILAGERQAHAVRARRILLEPDSIVVLPRIIGQIDEAAVKPLRRPMSAFFVGRPGAGGSGS